MMLKRCLLLLPLLFALFLSGCGDMPSPDEQRVFQVQTPSVRQAELKKIKFWRARGVFSIQQDGQVPQIAHFDWSQHNRGYRLTITSALGLYQIMILHSFHSVTLWKNGVEAMTAKTPEKLMLKAVGWSLPVSQLQYWIKGVPAPQRGGMYAVEFDSTGHLIGLKQAGWAITYQSYKTHDHGMDFPQTILMSRSGITVKIVLGQWDLLTAHYPLTGFV